jgi:hypothetical protein
MTQPPTLTIRSAAAEDVTMLAPVFASNLAYLRLAAEIGPDETALPVGHVEGSA